MDADALPLRDIHLPEPVSWWPPAPGWWLLAAVLIAGVVTLALLWRRHVMHRARRAALAELEQILAAFERTSDRHACARALSRLARRVALHCRGRDAAALTDAPWLALLGELGGGELPPALGRALAVAPYSPVAAEAIATEDYRAAAAAMRTWIERAPAGGRLQQAA